MKPSLFTTVFMITLVSAIGADAIGEELGPIVLWPQGAPGAVAMNRRTSRMSGFI